MKVLTEDAIVACSHPPGTVVNQASQRLVTIDRRKVLVEIDPENRTIRNCPNAAPPFVPCLQTLRVATGYSPHLKVDGKRICLDTVTGFTTGTPPGAVLYFVRAPGQKLVSDMG